MITLLDLIAWIVFSTFYLKRVFGSFTQVYISFLFDPRADCVYWFVFNLSGVWMCDQILSVLVY